MGPHGDRKKGKGPERPGKPELRANRKEFKKHHKEKGDVIEEQEQQQQQQPAPHSAALFNAADDGDFPRGGRSLLSRDEMAEARTEAEAEFDKEERRGKKKRNANVSLGMDGDDDLGTLFGSATTGKLPRFANRITLKNISPNMKLWGVVIEVNQKDIIDNDGSLCAEVVHVGQLVPCMVLRVDDDKKEGKVNKRVWLSLRLSRMYKGLSLDAIQDGMIKDLKGLSIDHLIPGMMMSARVHSVLENGIMLSFLTYFTGTADIFNLSNSFPSGNWKDDYSKNKKVNARILFVDPSTRAVGLTLNQHLLRLNVPPINVKVGEIYDKSRVLRMDKRAGLFLEIPSPTPSPGFVSIHDVSDKDVKNVEKKFREGSLTRVRVLGVRHLEGVALGTLKDSAFEGSVFTHADVKPGMVVRAKVVTVEPFGAIVQFSSGVKALCPLPHMSELDNVVKPPKKFKVKSKLEVLASYADAKIGLVTHGWITKIEKHGCFVRFYNGVQGFVSRAIQADTAKVGTIVSGVVERLTPGAVVVSVNGFSKGSILNEQLADYHVDRPIEKLSDAFCVGQSVRSHVLNVNAESARVKLSLQQSMCSSPDCSFIRGYFLLDKKIAALKYSGPSTSHDWMKSFGIGSLVKGEVGAVEEYGVILNFKDHPDVVGLIEHHQLGGNTVKVGSSVKGLVVDFSDGVVNVSLKPELVDSVSKDGKKKVLSVPEYNYAIGFAPLMDYNSQLLPHHNYDYGQRITVVVGSIPNSDPSGRLILLPKASAQDSGLSSSKRAKKKSDHKVGSLVEAEIIDIKPLELILKFGANLHGRVHITEVLEEHCCENPFSNLRIGQKVQARIVAEHSGKSGRNLKWELSVKPSVLKGSEELSLLQAELDHYVNGIVRAYVVKVDKEWVWLTLSRDVMAHLFILDSSVEPSELKEFQLRYSVGQAVKGRVIGVNREKRLLRLKALDNQCMLENVKEHSVSSIAEHTREGDIIGGCIQRILPGVGGLVIKIGPHLHGRVHYTEIVDSWVLEPLSEFHEGQFVKCKVLTVSRPSEGSVRVDLSLRSSIICANRDHSRLVDDLATCTPRFEKIDDLCPGTEVKGYVKNVNAKGCFVMLSRMVEARIILSNLSDEYVENPQKDFSVGMLVQGRVLSAEPISGKVEVSLRKNTGSKSQKSCDISYSDLHVGGIIDGQVKRVESYGLFVTIQSSELIDVERHRVSLGLKKSYFDSDLADGINDNENDDERVPTDISHCPEMSGDLNRSFVLPGPEPRASVPPLQVSLDEYEGSDQESGQKGHATANGTESNVKKSDKREIEISALEDRALQKDKPQTPDEFEKLVRSSPNSSFVWINYMAFLLDLADVEKARSVAERALRTINIREEEEKLNVWVAYFNLENEYGSPREDAVKKIFQRALQYCDPKKVHLALLGMYERTKQHELADALFDRMTKRFKTSCKIWLRRIHFSLSQQKDVEYIKSVVNRALLSLPQSKRIKFLSQTAILEFKCGVPEEGRSRFELILREYPKRTDLWSVYLDQEIRVGDTEIIRALFDRVTCLSLPPKKMKFLFKKYLSYEKSQGDEERIEHVKQKALEYVEILKA
ncbi:hypothetical protein ACQ4PT_016250 [Festuca glaucescens]